MKQESKSDCEDHMANTGQSTNHMIPKAADRHLKKLSNTTGSHKDQGL